MSRPTPAAVFPQPTRLGLRTFLLAAAVSGVFAGYLLIDRQRDALKTQVEQMAGEALMLRIGAPGRYHVIRDRSFEFRTQRWKIYLPPGRTYRVHLATRDIPLPDASVPNQFIPPAASASLAPGEHLVQLEYTNRTDHNGVRVLVDEREVIALPEADTWGNSSGTSYGAGALHQQEDFPIDEPLQLLRLHFMIDQPGGGSASPRTPDDGLLLWIETNPAGKRTDAVESAPQ